jgi:hypothetical protein
MILGGLKIIYGCKGETGKRKRAAEEPDPRYGQSASLGEGVERYVYQSDCETFRIERRRDLFLF